MAQGSQKRPRRRAILARIRKVCLFYPETSERMSHGSPTFFIRDKRSFVMYLDNPHGTGGSRSSAPRRSG